MKITSRPTADDQSIGSGDNVLRLTDAQLDLVMALVCHCRLGAGTPASTAALELAGAFTDAFDDMTVEEAVMNLSLTVSVEDSNGDVVFNSIDGYAVTLNV